MTFTKCAIGAGHAASRRAATGLAVASRWRSTRSRTSGSSSSPGVSRPTDPVLQRAASSPSGRSTKAVPPDIPAAKFRPGGAEHDDDAAGHVLAAVVAHALDHRVGAGVANGEPLAGEAATNASPEVAP